MNVGRVASVTVGARTTTITYDSAGRVVAVAAPTGTVGYADFDALGRPGSITLPGGRVVTQAYDPNGNVTTVTPPSGALPGNAHGFGFTLGNKLASYTPPLVSAPAVTTYTYDRDELLKQILSPLQPALSPLITRDLVGRVVKVTEGTRERTFVYDKGHVVQEGVTGVPDTVGLARTYGRSLLWKESQGIGLLGANELVRDYDDLLRVTSQSLTESVTAGFERVPFGFAAVLYDDATGLVRFGAREYDPGTGRWLSKDAARFGGGWNFYESAKSDPVNFSDQDGRQPLPMPGWFPRLVGCLQGASGWADVRICLGRVAESGNDGSASLWPLPIDPPKPANDNMCPRPSNFCTLIGGDGICNADSTIWCQYQCESGRKGLYQYMPDCSPGKTLPWKSRCDETVVAR